MKKNMKGKQGGKRMPSAMIVRGSVPRVVSGSSNLSAKQSVAPISVQIDMPITPQIITLVAGAIAQNSGMTPPALINAWATRIKTLFAEYRLLGIKLVIRQINVPVATASGVTVFYFDEKTNANPTAATAQDRPRVEIPNSPVTNDKISSMSWVANDLLDEDWTDCAVNATPVYLKTYSDVANFGSSATTVTSFMMSGSFRLQFRSLV
jgi:hypothetical protein